MYNYVKIITIVAYFSSGSISSVIVDRPKCGWQYKIFTHKPNVIILYDLFM